MIARAPSDDVYTQDRGTQWLCTLLRLDNAAGDSFFFFLLVFFFLFSFFFVFFYLVADGDSVIWESGR